MPAPCLIYPNPTRPELSCRCQRHRASPFTVIIRNIFATGVSPSSSSPSSKRGGALKQKHWGSKKRPPHQKQPHRSICLHHQHHHILCAAFHSERNSLNPGLGTGCRISEQQQEGGRLKSNCKTAHGTIRHECYNRGEELAKILYSTARSMSC